MSNSLTKQHILDFMNELSVDAKDHTRQFYVQTGVQGKKIFDEVLKKQVRIDSALRQLVLARSLHRLTKEEANTIREMIHSPDLENLTVAECVLKEKIKR